MPPTRTIPPAKAMKTERTHEENQERAYIAASRRSDRSLEARVESARRASEIHKRRTGRSLRVTEQDVINEEMYEEEDDDLPLQYRRLTAHLQTGSVDFNRRLAAYLTNQVAMRSAMEQMVNNSYAQQFANPAQFQARPNMYPSPITQSPLTTSPTNTHRSAPYPNPHNATFRQAHGRAYSTAVLPNKGDISPPSMPNSGFDQRRMSTPASMPPGGPQSLSTESIKQDPDYQRQTQSAMTPNGHFPPLWQDMGPFTTSLPPESQQMLAPALDPNDPFSSMLMQGSENYIGNPYYPWHQQPHTGKQFVHPSYNGMSATLAPSALDNSTDALSATPVLNHSVNDGSAPSAGLDFNFGADHKGLNGYSSSQGLASGQVTPGGDFWDSFVQENGWSEEAVAK